MAMRFLDFFAGIGGFRLGMEMAGHECVGHCEIDENANRSYIAMHRPKESEWYARDITTVDPWDLPQAEVYCFGFPCQTFSIAGARRGFEDTRGTLFFEVMRLAKERKPDLLFAENVKGLLNHDSGRTFGTIIRTMDELGYDVEWQLCNSKYMGIPQNRERVFIIGHYRNGRCTRKILPLDTRYTEVDELQGYEDSANTLDLVGRECRGIYPIDLIDNRADRQSRPTEQTISQSERLPQTAIAGFKLGIKLSEVACTLCARDYKGISNSGLNVVIE